MSRHTSFRSTHRKCPLLLPAFAIVSFSSMHVKDYFIAVARAELYAEGRLEAMRVAPTPTPTRVRPAERCPNLPLWSSSQKQQHSLVILRHTAETRHTVDAHEDAVIESPAGESRSEEMIPSTPPPSLHIQLFEFLLHATQQPFDVVARYQ